MTDKDKLKNASKNVIDIMSTLGKQFVEEALDQGEPILNMFNELTKNASSASSAAQGETNFFNKDKWISVHSLIKYYGEDGIFQEIYEDQGSFTLLFKLCGVNKQDLIVEKNDNSIEIFCKTSIAESRIYNFKYTDCEIKFKLKFDFDIQQQNILAELRDGLLKINVDKPIEEDSSKDEIITVV